MVAGVGAGFAVAGVIVLGWFTIGGAEVAAPFPLAGVAPAGVELAPAGVVAGVGNDVSGVGIGGNGLLMIPAISSGKPVSDLFLNLYQSVRAFIHSALFGSLPPKFTARA